MNQAKQNLVSGSSRPLLLRKRPDLVVQQQEYLGRRYWVIKDPVALKYYRFEEEEYTLLEMLDGQISLDELQYRFEARFAPQRITRQELHQLVGMLHRSSLLLSDAPDQGRQLLQRRRDRSRRARWAALGNVLSIRIPVCDPDGFLGWLHARVGWVFSPLSVACSVALVAAALLLVATHFESFQQKLPGFHEFFAAGNWIWLAVALALTKLLHEFGHGLACKRFGGQCHEMGLMILVLTPCLYCNVTDSWMLRSKWRRAAIGAAGMYVELVLAAVCTFVWWFSAPGLLHYLCLNVMFVGSVSTLLFNVNPLLRYDGYYILSDLVEVPNLRQKAGALLRRKTSAWILGMDTPPDPFLPQRRQWLLAVYAIAAALYRWVITIGILWFLNLVFRPYGVQVLGQVLAVAALYGLLIQPAWQLARFFRVPGRIDRVNKTRLAAATAATIGGLAMFWFPLPHYVSCGVFLEPEDAASVYAEAPGHIRQVHARPGDWVRAGSPLLTLENLDTHLAITRLSGERQKYRRRLQGYRQRAFEDDQAALQIAEIEQALAAIEEQVAHREQDAERLAIRAPRSGVILPAPRVAAPAHDQGRLPHWSGTALDDQNRDAFLQSGTPICHIGDAARFHAVLAIDQTDLEFVRVGQPVDILLEQLPGKRYRSELVQLSLQDMKISPRGLSSKQGGELLTTYDASGQERPRSTTFQASAPLIDEDGLLFLGATGHGRIRVGSQSLARRLWRYLCHTFRFVA